MTTVWKTAAGFAWMSLGMGVAGATVVYDANGSYLIQASINDNVEIKDGAQVTVRASGEIVGVDAPASALQGAVLLRTGRLDVLGNGQIDSGPLANAVTARGSSSVVHLGGQARIFGNVVNEITPAGWRTETAPTRLNVDAHAVVDGNIEYAGFVRVADQAAILGNIGYPGNGSYSLDMQGGIVSGDVRMGGINGYQFNMDGGTILGGVDASNAWIVDTTMSGGYIANGFHAATRSGIQGEIKGGQIDGGISIASTDFAPSSDLTLSGGQFNAEVNDWLLSFSDQNARATFSQLDIWGGQFGYQEAGLGFYFDNFVNLTVHGRDLYYDGGWLTGYLTDGSWFSNALTFGEDWRGTLTIQNVPEPGTLGLLTLSLAATFFVRRRKA